MSDRAAKSKAQRAAPPGVIQPQCLYTAEEAKRRLRVGEWAWRKMRADGLIVLRVAGRAFVHGRDLISFVESKGRAND